METLLARELQQACLETLVRKQTSEPPPISSAHGHSPFSLPPSSGSSAPSDPGAGIPSPQPDDLESLHDPVHQAISDILMEEDIDERPCMYAECVSYMKSLYDIIGSNEASVCPDTDEAGLVQNDCSGPFGFEGERSVVTEGDGAFRGFSASFDDKELDAVNYLLHGESSAVEDEGSGVYTQTHGMEPSNYLIQTEQFLNVPSYEAENVLISTSSEQFDYLINNNVNAIRLPQGVSAGAVLSPAASVSSYNGFPRADLSVQHQAGNAAFDWQDPVIDMISLSSSSAVTEVAPYIQARYHDTQFVSNGGDQDNITTGSNERVAILSRVRATNRLRSETFQKLPRRKCL